ncbi:MAG: methyltransferase domain-containing protein [Nitrospirae bacterium]|nr:methyltransferase domain-containing protein [Nitrospirota bacterium]
MEPVPHTRGMLLDWLAPIYDWGCPKIGIGPTFRNTTLRYAGLKAGEQVLDVGCGTGVLTRLAADVVGPTGQVIGIDPGPKMIAIARNNTAQERSRAEFRLDAIENLPFEDDRFDCVLSSFMIHHLPPDLKFKGLAEVYRVLKPGGRLLVVDISRPSNPLWWFFIWPLLFLRGPFTKDHFTGRLIGYFLEAGFYPVETVGHWAGIVSFWLAHKPQE